jgi:hypothetical protein
MNNAQIIAASLLLSLYSAETVGVMQQENSVSLSSEALSSEALSSEALSSEALSSEALSSEALPSEALTLEELPLETLIWENRVLIVDAKTSTSADILAKQFETHANQMWDRKLIALLLIDDSVIELRFTQEGMTTLPSSTSKSPSNSIRFKYSESELRKRLSGKQSILIGLDGGTKSAYTLNNGQIDIKQVFADVDGMPMRRWP